jgi:hypothetical protein
LEDLVEPSTLDLIEIEIVNDVFVNDMSESVRFNGGKEAFFKTNPGGFVLEGLVVHRRDLDVSFQEETSSSKAVTLLDGCDLAAGVIDFRTIIS